jgi:hypothetical protein
MCFRRISLLIIAFLLSLGGASATEVNLSYTGKTTRMFYGDCQNYSLSGSCNSWDIDYLNTSSVYENNPISVGDSFSGSFTYDSNAQLSGMSSDGAQAVYLDAVSDYKFELNNIFLPNEALPRARLGDLSIVNDRTSIGSLDSFFVSYNFSSPLWFVSINFNPMDKDATVYNNFEIPTSIYMNDFESLYFHMAFLRRSDGDQLHLYGTLTDIITDIPGSTPVPEPSAFLLLGTGIIGLAFLKKKRA